VIQIQFFWSQGTLSNKGGSAPITPKPIGHKGPAPITPTPSYFSSEGKSCVTTEITISPATHEIRLLRRKRMAMTRNNSESLQVVTPDFISPTSPNDWGVKNVANSSFLVNSVSSPTLRGGYSPRNSQTPTHVLDLGNENQVTPCKVSIAASQVPLLEPLSQERSICCCLIA